MKKVILFMFLVCSFGTYAQTKIGLLNSKQAIDTIPSRKKAVNEVIEFRNRGIREIQFKDSVFQNKVATFQVKSAEMSKDLMEMEKSKLLKEQEQIKNLESELTDQVNKLIEGINIKYSELFNKAVKEVAEQKKVDCVMDESMLILNRNCIVLTPFVIETLLKMDKM